MRLLASYVILSGDEEKHIRLYHGDLAAIPQDEAVDLLVVSAFPNDYTPTPTSLIGALNRLGVSVLALSTDKETDLRGAFLCWLSKDLSTRFPTVGFRRILCLEAGRQDTAPQTVSHIFRAMMPFLFGEQPIQTVALPVVGAGDQGHDPEVMLRALFDAAAHWLARGLPVRTIKLVVYLPELVDRLRNVFNGLAGGAGSSASLTTAAPGSPGRYDYFVNYAREDSKAVDALVVGLHAANPRLRIFVDRLEMKVGASWQSEIDEALTSCRRVIPVYSPSFMDSKPCLEEFGMARVRHRESGDLLKPIWLRPVKLPLYMQTLNYIDCQDADLDLVRDAAARLEAGA